MVWRPAWCVDSKRRWVPTMNHQQTLAACLYFKRIAWHYRTRCTHAYRDSIELRSWKIHAIHVANFQLSMAKNFNNMNMMIYRRDKRDVLICTLDWCAVMNLFGFRCKSTEYVSTTGSNDVFNSKIRVVLHTRLSIMTTHSWVQNWHNYNYKYTQINQNFNEKPIP